MKMSWKPNSRSGLSKLESDWLAAFKSGVNTRSADITGIKQLFHLPIARMSHLYTNQRIMNEQSNRPNQTLKSKRLLSVRYPSKLPNPQLQPIDLSASPLIRQHTPSIPISKIDRDEEHDFVTEKFPISPRFNSMGMNEDNEPLTGHVTSDKQSIVVATNDVNSATVNKRLKDAWNEVGLSRRQGSKRGGLSSSSTKGSEGNNAFSTSPTPPNSTTAQQPVVDVQTQNAAALSAATLLSASKHLDYSKCSANSRELEPVCSVPMLPSTGTCTFHFSFVDATVQTSPQLLPLSMPNSRKLFRFKDGQPNNLMTSISRSKPDRNQRLLQSFRRSVSTTHLLPPITFLKGSRHSKSNSSSTSSAHSSNALSISKDVALDEIAAGVSKDRVQLTFAERYDDGLCIVQFKRVDDSVSLGIFLQLRENGIVVSRLEKTAAHLEACSGYLRVGDWIVGIQGVPWRRLTSQSVIQEVMQGCTFVTFHILPST